MPAPTDNPEGVVNPPEKTNEPKNEENLEWLSNQMKVQATELAQVKAKMEETLALLETLKQAPQKPAVLESSTRLTEPLSEGAVDPASLENPSPPAPVTPGQSAKEKRHKML